MGLISFSLSAQLDWSVPVDNPEELGDVNWIRDYDQALAQSKEKNKPVLILFQEVPGCSTCRNYGKNVMSHPLIVEAIETYFVPLCIYNNKKGKDAKVLGLYGEPSWNNPVVRMVDGEGKNLVPRLAGNYSASGLVALINKYFRKEGKAIPAFLEILEQEISGYHDELVLAMYCFWTGEKAMAEIPGVVATEAGFMNGKEVVKVTYNADLIKDEQLVNAARSRSCADVVFSNDKKYKVSTVKKGKYRRDPETKYYLYNSDYKYIPMTPLQQLKANKELSAGGDITYFLSPRQLQLWEVIQNNNYKKNNIGIDLHSAWIEVSHLNVP